MAGLTNSGFVPEVLADIKSRIESRLTSFNTGIDFSPESPDGQLVGIMAAELSLAWDELGVVYNSYNPYTTSGEALRNLALITGTTYRTATRSTAPLTIEGVAGTVVPAGIRFSDLAGNEFYLVDTVTIPTTVALVSAVVVGQVPVVAGTIVNIETPVTGMTSISHVLDGTIGNDPDSEVAFRNERNRSVLRNTKSMQESLYSTLHDTGIDQVLVVNNDTNATLGDGTPPYSIHVTIGETYLVSDLVIAQTIYHNKGLGVLTHGTTTVAVLDSQGYSHDVKFTKSVVLPVYIDLEVTFLTDNSAGAIESIKTSLMGHINSLLVGEDVVWSRLFEYITPYGKAQVNSLTIGIAPVPTGTTNIAVSDTQFVNLITTDINVTEV